MLLDECVNTYDDDEMLFIGAASGFVFIGTPIEYEETIDRVSKRQRAFYKSSASKKKAFLKALMKPIGKREDEEPEDYIKRMQETATEIEKALACYKKAKVQLDRFTPFRERIVRTEYKRDLGGTAIIVSGPENGKYWTKEEWDKDEYKIG